MNSSQNAIEKSWMIRFFVFLQGVFGLWVCAPGFRPKHIRDIVVPFASMQGLGVVAYAVAILLLVPAANRLKKGDVFKTAIGSLFILLCVLLSIDLFFDVILNVHEGAPWILRLSYLGMVFWGFSGHGAFFKDGFLPKVKKLWTETNPVFWKIFLAVILFFLIRQEMHLYVSRGAPGGDEIYLWFTGARRIMNEGLRAAMQNHGYTPAIIWLIAFPARLCGIHDEAWLFAYPFFIFFMFLGVILEIAFSSLPAIAGITGLFFTFLCSRDLHSLYGASLYGEATAALWIALLFIELYRWRRPSRASVSGLGLFLGLCSLSKPPLSVFALPIAMLSAVYAFFQEGAFPRAKPLKERLHLTIIFLGGAFVPFGLWKTGLSLIGGKPEYSVSMRDLLARGIRLDIIAKMIRGLFNAGSPQLAYTLGLLATACLSLCVKNIRFFLSIGVLILVYWGFVFGLYATLWQNVEQGSAGRYISHAAIACLLVLPLAFYKDYDVV